MCARELDPIGHDVICAKPFEHEIIDLVNVIGIVRERDPAERPDGACKQRPQERLAEDRNVEGIGDAAGFGLGADQISIVEHNGARLLQGKHGRDMPHDRSARLIRKARRIACPQRAHIFER